MILIKQNVLLNIMLSITIGVITSSIISEAKCYRKQRYNIWGINQKPLLEAKEEECSKGVCTRIEYCSCDYHQQYPAGDTCGKGLEGTWVCCHRHEPGVIQPKIDDWNDPKKVENKNNIPESSTNRIIYPDSGEDFSGKSPSDWKLYPKSAGDGCLKGFCTLKENCDSHSDQLLPPTGLCGERHPGAWICCLKNKYEENWNVKPTTERNTMSSVFSAGSGRDGYTTYKTTTSTEQNKQWRFPTVSTSPTSWHNKPEVAHTKDGCIAGTCVKKEDCQSQLSQILTPTGLCGKRRGAIWVCCVRNAEKGTTSNPTESATNNHRRTTTKTPLSTFTPEVHQVCGFREGYTDGRRSERLQMHPETEWTHTNSQSTASHTKPFDYIVGGKEVEPFSWPWVVALYKESAPGIRRFLSSGSLISDRYVLTAAHVFMPEDISNATSFTVTLGTHTGTEAIARYQVQAIHLHPEYKGRYYYHDIALLKLSKVVSFSQYVLPVCLPALGQYEKDSDLLGKNVTVTGWGDDAFGGVSSEVLKEATFPIASRRECNSSYIGVASSKFPNGITDNMICAGAPDGGKDACQGDSGGSLTLKQGKTWVQVGVVSFGYRCGDANYPGVYTKVSKYVRWIRKTMQVE